MLHQWGSPAPVGAIDRAIPLDRLAHPASFAGDPSEPGSHAKAEGVAPSLAAATGPTPTVASVELRRAEPRRRRRR